MSVKYYFFKPLLSVCALASILVGLDACSRDPYREELNTDTDFLIIQSMLEEPEDLGNSGSQGTIQRSATHANQGFDPSSSAESKYVEGDDFDAIVSGRESPYEHPARTDLNAVIPSHNTSGRAATPMPVGIKYRLVLYKQSGNNLVFWRQKQLISKTGATLDTTQQIEVVRGDSYTWYAYSYNNTGDISPLSNTSTEAAVSMGENADFLYATGTVTIPTQGSAVTPLNVLFRHQMARIGVEVDARGMFADEIRQLGVTLSGLAGLSAPLTSGTFRLRDGNISAPVNQPVLANLTLGNFQNVEPPFNDRKAIYFYSTSTIPTFQLGANLTTIGLHMDDGPTERVFTNANRNFTFNTVEVTRGRTYQARIDLIESPLTVGGVRWARTNLYVHPTKTRNPYRFHTTTAHSDLRGSFFPFSSADPYTFANGQDPCERVHPTRLPNGLSAWRQPTLTEMGSLAGTTIPVTPTYATVNNLGYFLYPATGTAQPYGPTTELRINMNGFGQNISLVNNLINIEFPRTSNGTLARIWSSTRLLDIPPLAGLGGYYYSGGRFLGANSISTSSLELLTLRLLGGINVIESTLQNVRCVRR